MKLPNALFPLALAATLHAGPGPKVQWLDWDAVHAAYLGGHRDALKAPLEGLLGSGAASPSDHESCLRYLSAIYGDEEGGSKRATGYMLQLVRLDPRRDSLGLPVRPATDSLFRAVSGEFRSLGPEESRLLVLEKADVKGPGTRALPWLAGLVAVCGLGAAIAVMAWP